MRCLNCFLLEAEEVCRELLRRALLRDEELVLVGQAVTASEGVTLVKECRPDILFLGVELPDSNGFDFLRMLRESYVSRPAVVFVSSCDRYAIKALDVCAAGYLLKPIDEEKLTTALALAKRHAKSGLHATGRLSESPSLQSSRIVVKVQGRLLFLLPDTIDWIQACGNYLTLYVGREEYAIRESIQSLERRLQSFPFLRIHRSTIVNVNRIREVERWYTGEYIVRLETGKELTLSKTYRDQFFAATAPHAS